MFFLHISRIKIMKFIWMEASDVALIVRLAAVTFHK